MDDQQDGPLNERRPIASRRTVWAQRLTRMLAKRDIAPNHISMASMGFALLAALAFIVGLNVGAGARFVLLLMAAAFCQARLICNLLDGLVAVEEGKGTPDGAFWNEAPDRVSDVLILAGLGYGLGLPVLGWAAAAMAIGTAYMRELGRATTGHNDFSGPLAKPHRMAVVTIAAVLAALATLWGQDGQWILSAALWIVAVGAALTSVRRSVSLIARMNARP